MSPASGAGEIGWEAVEAAAGFVLRSSDAIAASAEWPGPLTGARRIGGVCRLTEMVAMGLGATVGAPPGTLAVSLAGPAWPDSATGALTTAVERRAPLVVLLAAPGTGDTARAAAEAAGATFDLVEAADVERCAGAVERCAGAARAGAGPALVACTRDADDDDPLELYVGRLSRQGVSRDELREVARAAERGS